MADPQTCPHCGAAIPAGAPADLCPKCLLRQGLGSEGPPGTAEGAVTESQAERSATGFVPPQPSELAARFSQLEILELIGHGGMGAVYKARQPGLERIVAVKILPPHAGQDPAFAERFAREARAMARLSHPHITNVYDFGQSDGLFYLVMEYVDGVNVRQAIRAGTVTPKVALEIVTQVCEALQYAHDEGVVHRDIKPENILLDRRGRVKIADFGLAKLLGGDAAVPGLTGTHQVMGTLRYMAPEQMEGSRAVDHRADIYSLGVVFYELLTGEVPMGRFQPPSEKVQIDVRLDEVVLKSLEREPERRYQQASEVKSGVDAVSDSYRSTKTTAQASEHNDLERLIRRMLRENRGLAAIRAYRAATGASLREAHAEVRRLAAAEGLPLQRLSAQRRLMEIALMSLALAVGLNLGGPGDYLVVKIFALMAYVVLVIGHGVGARRERRLAPKAPGKADGLVGTKGTPLHASETPDKERPSVQPNIGADQPAEVSTPVSEGGDFLVMNPRLPTIAQWICAYVIIINPLCWLFVSMLDLLNPAHFDSRSGMSFLLYFLIPTHSVDLALVTLAAIGGLKYRALQPSGPTWVRRALTIRIVMIVLEIVILFVTIGVTTFLQEMAASNPARLRRFGYSEDDVASLMTVFEAPLRNGDHVSAGLSLIIFAADIAVIVWLRRHRASLMSPASSDTRAPDDEAVRRRSPFGQRWDYWWRRRDRRVVIAVQVVLAAVIFVSATEFFSFTTRYNDADNRSITQLGKHDPWFTIETSSRGGDIGFNLLASSCRAALLAWAAGGLLSQIEKTKPDYEEGTYSLRGLVAVWMVGAVIAVIVSVATNAVTGTHSQTYTVTTSRDEVEAQPSTERDEEREAASH
jgi:serine/threonine protein kinase